MAKCIISFLFLINDYHTFRHNCYRKPICSSFTLNRNKCKTAVLLTFLLLKFGIKSQTIFFLTSVMISVMRSAQIWMCYKKLSRRNTSRRRSLSRQVLGFHFDNPFSHLTCCWKNEKYSARQGEKRSFKSAFRVRPIKSSFTRRRARPTRDPSKGNECASRATFFSFFSRQGWHLFAGSRSDWRAHSRVPAEPLISSSRDVVNKYRRSRSLRGEGRRRRVPANYKSAADERECG